MCLGIPGKIITITPSEDAIFRKGKVSFGGILKDVNLSMVPEATINDYVLVHVGLAISVINEEEAAKTLLYLQQMMELDELEPTKIPPVTP